MKFILFVTVLCIGTAVGAQAASTMPPAITNSTTTPVSDVTVGPTTKPPVTTANIDTTSFEPASFVPLSSEDPFSTGSTMPPNTGSTMPPNTGSSATPSVNTGSTSISTGTQTTTIAPTSAPNKSAFDGASFGGRDRAGPGVRHYLSCCLQDILVEKGRELQ